MPHPSIILYSLLDLTVAECAGLPRFNRSSNRVVAAAAEGEQEPGVKYNKEFGYSRKDVVLIGVGLIVLGYALYYGLQAAGVDPLMAGNFTQLIIFVGLCVGWIGSYVFRVVNKVRFCAFLLCFEGFKCEAPSRLYIPCRT
jgi:hypothetical protein